MLLKLPLELAVEVLPLVDSLSYSKLTWIGADGLAFWYVQNPKPNGPIFGSSDEWKGLAVIFDTFDNDRQGNNPYISVYNNDGTWKYDPNTDGSDHELGGCKINYRNWDTKVRISYVEGVLMVNSKKSIIAHFEI